MHQQFGRLMGRGPGENAKVSVLLTDYEDVDKILAKVSSDGTPRPGPSAPVALSLPLLWPSPLLWPER